jgi:hypothetical protein
MKTRKQARAIVFEILNNDELLHDIKAICAVRWEDLLTDLIITEIYGEEDDDSAKTEEYTALIP